MNPNHFHSVALQFVRKLLVDAAEIRKHTKFAGKLKEQLNEADILLMKSYFKPKFNSKDENVVNRKLCGQAMKVRIDILSRFQSLRDVESTPRTIPSLPTDEAVIEGEEGLKSAHMKQQQINNDNRRGIIEVIF